jgi:hypothetical protein
MAHLLRIRSVYELFPIERDALFPTPQRDHILTISLQYIDKVGDFWYIFKRESRDWANYPLHHRTTVEGATPQPSPCFPSEE